MQGEFLYHKPFPIEEDETQYRLITTEYVERDRFRREDLLVVQGEGLALLSEQAFKDVSHLLRPSHLQSLAGILKDPDATSNDKYVALELIKNAVISAEGIFPMCQDTGTAIVIGKKGERVFTGICDEEAISKGIYSAYTKNYFRYSQNVPLSMYEEKNSGTNLPAQIDIYATEGNIYSFLFIAKGGGSANKTFLYQKTKALLNHDSLVEFLTQRIMEIGTSACPPYHLAVVVGGTSAEANLKTVKLATAGYLDGLPSEGNECGQAFRDHEFERELLQISRGLGIGAQFGGKYFCHDVRVIRLPRHGASLPIGIGVSCSADRNIKAKITHEGIYLEALERDPTRYLPEPGFDKGEKVSIDLDAPMKEIQERLGRLSVGDMVLLNGTMIVARDIAHSRIKEMLSSGEGLPDYFKEHPVYYAGPAKRPDGYPSGSFGPTTSARMDPYVPVFQEQGGSLVMVGKGNRSRQVVESCKRYRGFYLGSIGGASARIGRDFIKEMELIAFPELGMEAIYRIRVEDFPAFLVIDDKGNDFYETLIKS